MLDVKTAFLLWATEAGTLAMLLLVAWLRSRGEKHYLMFGLGFAAHALGIALVSFRGQIPDFVSIQAANFIALSAFGLWLSGLRCLDERPLASFAAIPSLIWVAGNLLPVVRDSFAHRMALYDVATAVGFSLMAATVATARFGTGRHRIALIGIWMTQALFNLGFAVAVVLQQPASFKDVSISALVGIAGIIGFVGSIAIIAKLLMDRSEDRLRLLAITDPLTGALNRRGLIDRFETIRARAGDMKREVALLVFDLDHFKKINDSRGHQAGDAVLVAFTQSCRSLMPANACFGRSGGEEFAALLDLAGMHDAVLVAEAIRRTVAEKPIAFGGQILRVTVSIGIATLPAAEADLDRLMSGADRALYKAKARGRNRTAVLTGEKVLCVPSSTPQAIDEQADRQVAALRRLQTMASSQQDLYRS
ncbi:GGDEF domain-containing protein [Rhizobium cremeum]|uniref:GGDEF domain-containing protein n=1 Tax=Rhizobium cremeum TaxID=2813827 RepID=UPI000DE0EB2E|nr:GGDEF domain-containing protein [Rhizobium cremeum]MCJ8000327.1 GGDEF domain-containing protein [Rhizobium cremeum]